MQACQAFGLAASGALFMAGCAAAAEGVPIRLSQAAHSAEVRLLDDGSAEVRTTGGDPYVVCERVAQGGDGKETSVFAFEYRCPEPLEFFEIFFGNPFAGHNRFGSGPLPPAPEWTAFAADLATVPGAEWGPGIRDFRIDFGDRGGRTIQVRAICLRAPTAAERQAYEARREAERVALRAVQERVNRTLIAPSRMPPFQNVIGTTHALEDAGGALFVSVIGKDLDLVSQVASHAASVPAPVPLAPSLVVGEGPSPANHTLVRVLNRYGLCEAQFLAYPESVRGGVAVAVGRRADGQVAVVTAPLTDATVSDLRVVGRYGSPLAAIRVAAAGAPPFAVAVGDFLPGQPGDEVAIASRQPGKGPARVGFYSLSGELLKSLDLPAGGGPLCLAAERAAGVAARLLVYGEGSPSYLSVDAERGITEAHDVGLPAECTGVYASAHAQGAIAAACREPLYSSLYRSDGVGKAERVDVGTRENRFWFTAGGPFRGAPEGRSVRHANFAHIRTDFASPMARTPDFARTDAEFWTGERYAAWVSERLKRFDAEPPTCWEPCFTHRWFYAQARQWAEARDPETGLPSYTLVTRDNETGTYGEFGETRSFVSGTYAPGVAPIECFYTYPLRGFLHELVRRVRANPEHVVAVEPNHEMEINAESESTHGDYNPNMLRAFYRYLMGLYGTLGNLNRLFATDFTPDRFDAPRNLERGPWDAYGTDNPYYMVWMRFLNEVIYRVVAGTYREALLAGFPPEVIKCHQIPDHYAIASLTAFSRPAQRVTPIDWNLNAGVGFGCTKYGVWYQQPFNCVQGPNSSGFDAMVIGEYQSLTPDAEAAYQQLVTMQGHGVQFIHCMEWPAGHDRGYNQSLAAALVRLAQADAPRPGQTGGTGQVRAVRQANRAYDIVSLGTREDTTGLLKSVAADGTWEGSVYVVPFHAHVDVKTALSVAAIEVGAKPIRVGPFPGIDAGNLVECSVAARAVGPGAAALSLRVYHHGIEMPDQSLVAAVGPEWRSLRFAVRVQMDTDDLAMELGSGDVRQGSWGQGTVALRDVVVVHHAEKTAKLKKGIFTGVRHQGGVTFDVLPDEG